MTAHKSKYLSDAVLGWENGSAMPAAPGVVYIALLTAMPTKNDMTGAVEVSGDGYTRTLRGSLSAITTNGDNVTEQASNTAIISFPADAVANWGTIVGCAEYDAATSGNPLRYGSLSASDMVAVGNQMQINIGGLTVSEF